MPIVQVAQLLRAVDNIDRPVDHTPSQAWRIKCCMSSGSSLLTMT